VDCIKNGFKAANICEYSNEEAIRVTSSEEEFEEESESEIESEIPASYNDILDLFNTESGEEFDGFD